MRKLTRLSAVVLIGLFSLSFGAQAQTTHLDVWLDSNDVMNAVVFKAEPQMQEGDTLFFVVDWVEGWCVVKNAMYSTYAMPLDKKDLKNIQKNGITSIGINQYRYEFTKEEVKDSKEQATELLK